MLLRPTAGRSNWSNASQECAAGLDVVKATGGRHVALVRQFKGIVADRTLKLALVPRPGQVTPSTAPIISGIELEVEESL